MFSEAGPDEVGLKGSRTLIRLLCPSDSQAGVGPVELVRQLQRAVQPPPDVTIAPSDSPSQAELLCSGQAKCLRQRRQPMRLRFAGIPACSGTWKPCSAASTSRKCRCAPRAPATARPAASA